MPPPKLNVTRSTDGYVLLWKAEEMMYKHIGHTFQVQYKKDTASWEVRAWAPAGPGVGKGLGDNTQEGDTCQVPGSQQVTRKRKPLGLGVMTPGGQQVTVPSLGEGTEAPGGHVTWPKLTQPTQNCKGGIDARVGRAEGQLHEGFAKVIKGTVLQRNLTWTQTCSW